MERYKIGFTAGTFDLFHIGHLNLIQRSKSKCDYLIVGVNSDNLVSEYKSKLPFVNEEERMRIVSALRDVDQTVMIHSLDKVEQHKKYGFDVVFIGDDWKGNERWMKTEEDLSAVGAKVCYLPYTDNVSTTKLIEKIIEINVND